MTNCSSRLLLICYTTYKEARPIHDSLNSVCYMILKEMEHSTLNTRHFKFNARQSAIGTRHSALGTRQTFSQPQTRWLKRRWVTETLSPDANSFQVQGLRGSGNMHLHKYLNWPVLDTNHLHLRLHFYLHCQLQVGIKVVQIVALAILF